MCTALTSAHRRRTTASGPACSACRRTTSTSCSATTSSTSTSSRCLARITPGCRAACVRYNQAVPAAWLLVFIASQALRPQPAAQVVKEALPVLQKAKKDGLIRHIGFSGYPLRIYAKLLDKCADAGAAAAVCRAPSAGAARALAPVTGQQLNAHGRAAQGGAGHHRHGAVVLPLLPEQHAAGGAGALPAVQGRGHHLRLPAVHGPARPPGVPCSRCSITAEHSRPAPRLSWWPVLAAAPVAHGSSALGLRVLLGSVLTRAARRARPSGTPRPRRCARAA